MQPWVMTHLFDLVLNEEFIKSRERKGSNSMEIFFPLEPGMPLEEFKIALSTGLTKFKTINCLTF